MRRRGALTVVLMIAAAAAWAQPPTGARLGDAVVAVVEKKVFTARDLDFWVFEERLLEGNLEDAPAQQLRPLILPDVIHSHLLAGWAELQIKAPPPEAIQARVNAAWDRYEKLAGGPEALRLRLADAGMDEAAFRLWMADRARASFFIREALALYANTAGEEPEDASVRDAVRIKLAHLLVRPRGNSKEAIAAARARALSIRRDITAGAPFSRMARLASEDEATGPLGGELGWFLKDEVALPLWEAALATRPGGVSPPVETESGFHLVTVLDFETPSQQSWRLAMEAEEARRLAELLAESDVRLATGYTLPPVEAPTIKGTPGFWERLPAGAPAGS